MTSNLGAELLVQTGHGQYYPQVQSIGEGLVIANNLRLAGNTQPSEGVDDNEISATTREAIMTVVNASFAPEFLNRIDEFIFFRRLSRDALRDIVDIRLRELQVRLDERQISLRVDNNVKDWLAMQSYDPRYGARPLNRLITQKIGNGLADLIIKGEVKSGSEPEVRLNESNGTLEVLPGH